MKSAVHWEIAQVFLKLGCCSFGGPIAHLGYLRHEFVTKRGWLSEERFAGLVGLCQFLPGPASSQIAFAIGALRGGGVAAGALASTCFLIPSAILMLALGTLLATAGSEQMNLHWLVDALKLVAAPFVAQAIYGMGRSLCPELHRLLICIAAAFLNIAFPSTLIQIVTIVVAGIWGAIWRQWGTTTSCGRSEGEAVLSRASGSILLLLFFTLLAFSIFMPESSNTWQRTFTTFYSAGSLVFGGGHVVLPLLRSQLVPPHLISDDLFLGGYGAAQALPGPLFSFAGYLGSVIFAGNFPFWGGMWCLFAMFLPAWLIVGGALPFWDSIGSLPRARALIAGANSAVVGILLAAFFTPVCQESLNHPSDFVIAVIAFFSLERLRVVPVAIVFLIVASHVMVRTLSLL